MKNSFVRWFSLALTIWAASLTVYAGGVVTSMTEGALRDALVGGGNITFSSDGVITVTNTIQITNAVTIDATGYHVTISGGGSVRVLLVLSGASLGLSGLNIADGYAESGGGGALQNNGDVTISDCTFSNNLSVTKGGIPLGSGGGAIQHTRIATGLHIARTLFVQNRSADFAGGAIGSGEDAISGGIGNIVVKNCTFCANSSFYDGGAVSLIGPFSAAISFVNCTFAWNTNGAIVFGLPGATPTGLVPSLANCVLAYSIGSTNAAGISDSGHNISSDSSSVFTNATSLTNTDPLLGALGHYGGPTLTVPLVFGSPAADKGDDSLAPGTDQRAVARPIGPHSDIGAFEGTVPPNNEVQLGFVDLTLAVPAVPGSAVVTIQRNGPLDGTASVNFFAQAGSAVDGLDFEATNLTVTFTNNESQKAVTVAILGGHPDADKTVLLTLTNATGGAVAAPATIILTIQSTNVETQRLGDLTDNALRVAMAAGGTIHFTNDGVIALTNTIVVNNLVRLDARDHTVTIQANSSFRLFSVQPQGSLTLENITLTGGSAFGADGTVVQADGTPGYGGAAFVDQGTLTLLDCHVWTNTARGGIGASANGYSGNGGNAAGGAIYVIGGILNATNSDFIGNSAMAGAGGTNSFMAAPLSSTGLGGAAFGGAVFSSYSVLNGSNNVWRLNQAVGGIGGLAVVNSQRSGDALGGAIFQTGGTGLVTACDFVLNRGASARPSGAYFGDGGNVQGGAVFSSNALFVAFGGKFTTNVAVGGDTLSGISGQGFGGALANFGPAQVSWCWFEGNGTSGGAQSGRAMGGAVYNGGSVQVSDTLFADNTASGGVLGGTAFGGALCNNGTALLTNITMFSNAANGGNVDWTAPQPDGQGGGLYTDSGTSFCANATIANNKATWNSGSGHPNSGRGGGVLATNGSTTLLNTILATNTFGGNGYGDITDAGHNISSDASCGFTAPGSLNSTDPVMGPLDDYGGPTPTIPLLAGSPAIDSGTLDGAPDHDQRGRSRPFGNGVDIGAFESSPPYVLAGKVYGFTLVDEVSVSDGSTTTITTTNRGLFRLKGLPVGIQTVSVTNSDYVFSPASQNVNLGPDRLDVTFQAFRWQTLSPEPLTNGLAQLVLAEPAGTTWRIDSSTNAVEWLPIYTNTLGANGMLQCLVPVNTTPPILYRAVKP